MRPIGKKLSKMAQVIAFVCGLFYTGLLFLQFIENSYGSNQRIGLDSRLQNIDYSQRINLRKQKSVESLDRISRKTDWVESNDIPDYSGDLKYPTSKLVNYDKLKSRMTNIDDLFISVKTTKAYHQTRLDVILKTWFILAREQTYFFTDANDDVYQQRANGHMINTNCSASHSRKALCCKMSVEFDTFLESNKRWFCHFDDDNYVNVPELVRVLQQYDPAEDWYLGKPSIRKPLYIMDRDRPNVEKISFWFATGGAGFCLSRSLAFKMTSIASGGKFISICDKIRLPDDVTMGYIIEHLLNKTLTVIEQFHSHLEPMKFIKPDNYKDQISFSYSRYGKDRNTVSVEGFDTRIDPTRFLSLHCQLFPNFSFCPR